MKMLLTALLTGIIAFGSLAVVDAQRQHAPFYKKVKAKKRPVLFRNLPRFLRNSAKSMPVKRAARKTTRRCPSRG